MLSLAYRPVAGSKMPAGREAEYRHSGGVDPEEGRMVDNVLHACLQRLDWLLLPDVIENGVVERERVDRMGKELQCNGIRLSRGQHPVSSTWQDYQRRMGTVGLALLLDPVVYITHDPGAKRAYIEFELSHLSLLDRTACETCDEVALQEHEDYGHWYGRNDGGAHHRRPV